MFNILIVLLGVAAVVGIHEACHMIVAKLFGVKVLKFSLGFGPVIFAKEFKGTSYQLAILPLGGYVQCAGESPESNDKYGFFGQAWYKRALIALAGPVANLLLGFAMVLGLLIFLKGWPILAGLGRAYSICVFVITTTLKWITGTLPAVKDATQGSGMAGPIMITKILISSLKEGVAQFVFVLSLISLSLGLFNLFPIPAMDGGHIFLYVLEGIRGRKFSSKIYAMWSYVGLVLLGGLMLFLCFSDILNLLK